MPIQDIYGDIYIQPFVDNQGNKIDILIENEAHKVFGNQFTLNSIPSKFYKVTIQDMVEIKINKDIENTDEFKVDYNHGIVYFHPSLEGQQINILRYYGSGVILYSAKRIYTEIVNGDVTETLEDLIEDGKVALEALGGIEKAVNDANAIVTTIEIDTVNATNINNTLINTNNSANTANTTLTNTINTANNTEEVLTDTVNDANDINTALNTTIDNADTLKANLDNSISIGNTLKSSLDNDISTGDTLHTTLTNDINTATTKDTDLNDTINNSVTVKTNLDNSISQSVTKKADLDSSIDTATNTNNSLINSILTGNQLKTNLDDSIEMADMLNTDLEGNINTGNTLHTTLNQDINTANSTKSTLDTTIIEANSANTTLTGSVTQGQNKIVEMDNKLDEANDKIAEMEQVKQQVLNTDVELKKCTAFDIGVTYQPLNRVYYQGSTYECLKQTVGNYPPSVVIGTDSNWQLIAKKGEDGLGTIRSVDSIDNNLHTETVDGNVTVSLSSNLKEMANKIVYDFANGIFDIVFE